jgi:hypothetical protein
MTSIDRLLRQTRAVTLALGLLGVLSLAAPALAQQPAPKPAPPAGQPAAQPAQPQPPPPPVDEPGPFPPEQRRWLEKWMKEQKEKIKEEVEASLPPPPPPQPAGGSSLGSIEWKGEFFTKWLYQNDQSNGCLTLGSPHPQGDNFSGNNGI